LGFMNPVVATSLINLGSNIVNKAFSSPIATTPVTKTDFESNLKSFQDQPVSKTDLEKVKTELLNSPELKEFLSKNSDCTISVDQFSDGSVRILSSSGDFITLNQNSPLLAKADQFLNGSLELGENLNPERTNSAILTG
jgi:hypothetical protein